MTPTRIAFSRWLTAFSFTVVSCTLGAVALAGETPEPWEFHSVTSEAGR